MTSSPGLMPTQRSAISRPVVALVTARAYLQPTYCRTEFSRACVIGPSVRKPLSRTAQTRSLTDWLTKGFISGIRNIRNLPAANPSRGEALCLPTAPFDQAAHTVFEVDTPAEAEVALRLLRTADAVRHERRPGREILDGRLAIRQ